MKGTLGNMMQQVQKMQEQMQEAQAEMVNKEVTGTAGGDIVKITMNGQQQVKAIKIDHDLIDGDHEMMEDLLVAAFNDALNKIAELQKDNLGGLTAGLNLPPGFKMPF
ncbi:YbaB/EbfC family nucleoid-associated protein [Marinicella sp. S1101]|uniref:YbaB/EbfC family nucleoid-associated protein n=1 Tax=Marinicella marina TaxID=2996016 RepID=UPI002260B19C|nr:YbaB/EbfC family nucleoid-associated protein [Marinicella marina]MCX7554991.1 YbaB/EbfC family nucleoid-associated protein [Marinicella marina]MDJ1141345.1 YbaB/EbfC family nucleoid-associated protein [Marinicella marina]